MKPRPWFPFVPLAFTACLAAQATVTAPAWSRARAVWFSKENFNASNPIAAEVCIGGPTVPFDDETRKAWEQAAPGTRMALGSAGWATLDTFTTVATGGVKVKQGSYYLALERSKDGWCLALLEPAPVHKAWLLPAHAQKERAVARLPLTLGTGADRPLGFALLPDGHRGTASLQIQWGTHVLSAALDVQAAAGAESVGQVLRRGCSRLALAAARDGKQPFALLDHGEPVWNGERSQEARQIHKGGRWRLGMDWWTTLDCNAPLAIGGRKLSAGTWHLSLRKTADDVWSLACTPAAETVGARLDAFGADNAKAVVEVPLVAAAGTKADTLKVLFAAEGSGHRLLIRFGDRELSAPLAVP